MNIHDFVDIVETLNEKAESVSDYAFEDKNSENVFRKYLYVMEKLHEFVHYIQIFKFWKSIQIKA